MKQAQALVLERQHELNLREIALDDTLGATDVRVAVHTVGICGSDVHYYTHGRIGPFVVEAPMVLGHEAAGTVIEVGDAVTGLDVGDRVCMEPGVPDMNSPAARLGVYNVDPAVTFWATPPIHGCLTGEVVHPAAFTYRLPDSVSFAEGAMVEPLAIGMQAAVKARMTPGDVCVVTGAGPIGLMVALSALAAGASDVIVSDLVDDKLDIAAGYAGITPVNVTRESLRDVVAARCGSDWGADVVFEASGSPRVYDDVLAVARPAGCVVLVGMPVEPVTLDIVAAQAKELRIETVFRYANVYDRTIALLASGKVDLKPLISETFDFKDSVAAFERAAEGRATDVKLQIRVSDG
ncbi:NAD(P)-dependent alcohol dehydrogenase [Salinisphaera sp. Q1T1-3]|uniref:NAD(P)-dependent alcohol dehydrogenase n=1 Tax=Salinisphaera sp. Q1T1-3 TaxID=2321229 RepID=UPI000E70E0E8|nr:NAD(P)-dependent alcohol dehydrogenase [Salinisphaera sp. Q1T1-3]RJS93373.1 NAD(P)-dependent alcohol dehydrogenase [Salinisphaera sp. Q1T1-3]